MGDAIAGGLRLGRNNRHFFAENLVQQRRFADIGPANNGNRAAAKRNQVVSLVLGVCLCH
jgi:hypothetical protein